MISISKKSLPLSLQSIQVSILQKLLLNTYILSRIFEEKYAAFPTIYLMLNISPSVNFTKIIVKYLYFVKSYKTVIYYSVFIYFHYVTICQSQIFTFFMAVKRCILLHVFLIYAYFWNEEIKIPFKFSYFFPNCYLPEGEA